ncbi:ATP-binding protein [Salinibius halmophilus]|uniref:ATP-binding protein n=1 Tax=Salinibius halmophilus TaxID=1853216 RepID=UPI000E668BC5|nr:ATP-binding protein [Salinibius halmophilus]
MRILVLLIALLYSSVAAAQQLVVGVKGNPNFSHAGILLAIANNSYQQAGLEVELKIFNSEQSLQAALLNEEVDIALANINLLKQVSPNQLLAVIEQIDDTAFVSANASNIINEIAAGAVYGNPNMYASTLKMLELHNLNNRIVYKVPPDTSMHSGILQNYNAIIVDHSTQGLLLRQQGLNFWQLISRDLGQPMYGDALFASSALTTEAGVQTQFTEITLNAWQAAYLDIGGTARTLARAFKTDRQTLVEQARAMMAFVLPEYLPIGQVSQQKLSDMFNESYDFSQASQRPSRTSVSLSGNKLANWVAPLVIVLVATIILFWWQARKATLLIRQQNLHIRALKRNQEDLKRLKTVIADSYHGCVHLSISENRMYFDSMAAKIFDMQDVKKEVTLDSFFDYLNPANQERVRRLFWNGIASNKAFTLVFDEQTTGNTRRINARFVPTSEREQLEYCMLVRDDSESLRLDNDMRQLRMSLDQAMRANESIRSQISRSINSHIEIIHQQMVLLGQDQTQSDQEDSIARAVISIDHVKNILKDITLHGSQEVRQHARLDVSSLIRSLYSRAMEKSHSRGLSVVLNEPSVAVTLLADSVRVRQLLAGILDNALKYTVHGQVSISTVIVERQLSLPWVELTVNIEDSGIGLSPEQLKQYQSTASDYSAAVSGIPYLKRLAEQCGASLHAESVEGEGTSVSLSVKAPKMPAGGNLVVENFSTLIVDMDRPYRRRLIDQLELLGVNVYVASNIRDALDEIKVNRPSNVLLAALNSTDASHQLTRLQEHQLDVMPPVSVLIDESAVNRQALLNLGATGVYTAPIAVNVLANLIEQAIEHAPGNQNSGQSS